MPHFFSSKSAIIVYTVFIDLLGFGILIPLGPVYVKKMGLSAANWGVLMATYSLVQLFFVPILGWISDRVGRRPILLLSIVASCGGHLLFALSAILPAPLICLFISRTIAGIGGANIATAQSYITDITSEKDRNKSMGLIGAGFGLGFTFGPALGGLVSPLGMTAPFFLASGLSALNFIFAYFFLPETTFRKPRSSLPFSYFQELRKAALEYKAWRPYLLTLILIIGFAMLEVSYVFFAMETFHIHEAQASMLFFAIGLQLFFIQGVLIRFVTRYYKEWHLIPFGLCLMSVGLFVIPFAKNFTALIYFSPLIALGTGLVQPSISSYISKLADTHNRGLLLGLNQSFGSMARIIGPITGGFLYTHYGALSFRIGALLLLIGGLFSLSFERLEQSD